MLRAVGFRVLVKPDPVLKKTKSGIIISTDERLERGATEKGTVVDVGPEAFLAHNRAAGFKDQQPWVTVGQRIYFARYAGKWVLDPEDREMYLAINDEDVIVRIENDLGPEDSTDHFAQSS